MDFAGGRAQAEYMTRVRGIAPERCLVVPVDVGKRSARCRWSRITTVGSCTTRSRSR